MRNRAFSQPIRFSPENSAFIRGATGFALFGLLLVLTSCQLAKPAKVRVVLITLDTLRYDSLMGGPGRPSDMPETLAWSTAKAAVFSHFYAATGQTAPTHASMFTGLHPWQHGLTRNTLVLDEAHLTLAERLIEVGFTTTAVVASPTASSSSGLDQGFERFVEAFPIQTGPNLNSPFARYALAETIEQHALEELERETGDHQFFWFHFVDPHSPYGDTAGEGRPLLTIEARNEVLAGADRDLVFQRTRDLYAADVKVLDRVLVRLLERLIADRERFETHIVITSDHGESLGENGDLGHSRHLTESVIRVPAVLLSPRATPGTRRDVAGSVDVHATILGMAGVPVPAGHGRDLLRQPDQGGAVGMRRTFAKPRRLTYADGREQLLDFDLFYQVDAQRPTVRSDCQRLFTAPGHELSAQERTRLLTSFRARCAQLKSRPPANVMDPKAAAELRALGYVP